MLSKSQKLSLGVVILLIVDVIWVASSELTKVRKGGVVRFTSYHELRRYQKFIMCHRTSHALHQLMTNSRIFCLLPFTVFVSK